MLRSMGRWRAARLLLLLAGAGWLAGAVATGQRYPGASFAWVMPALGGAALAAAALTATYLVAAWVGDTRAWQAVERAGAPLWLGWLVLAMLAASAGVNHYFANWSRLRVGVAIVVAGATLLATEAGLLLSAERRNLLLTRVNRRVGTAGLVFAGCLAVYVASGGGHLYTPDEWTVYAAAAGLVNHGVPAAFDGEPYPLNHLGIVASTAAPGQQAHGFSKYGSLPSLLSAPLYSLARLTGIGPSLPTNAFPYGNLALPLVPLTFGPIITALTAALVVAVSRRLGYGRHASLIAAGAFAFGSLAWPYSKTLLSMNLAGLLLFSSFACALWPAPQQDGRRNTWWLLGGGAFLGLAIATRYEVVLFSLPIIAFAGWRLRRDARAQIGGLASFIAGLAAAAAPLVLGFNLLRTGSLLDTGYGGEGTLASLLTKPWYGWLGITLSPGCGLVPHTPLMALGILALVWLWEDAPAAALVSGALSLLALGYYGSLSTTWCANATWGPRYLVAVAPFMALPLAAVWTRVSTRNPFVWLVGGGVAAWSVFTNLLAVLIDFNRGWQDHWAHGATYLEVTWLPFFSGITSHQRLLREWLLDGSGGVDLYLLYTAGRAGPLILVALIAFATACAVCAWSSRSDALLEMQGIGGAAASGLPVEKWGKAASGR